MWSNDILSGSVRVKEAPELRRYRFAEGILELNSQLASLNARFERIFGDCRVREDTPGYAVRCSVSLSDDEEWIEVRFDDLPLDGPRFILSLFSDRDCQLLHTDDDGWTWLAIGNATKLACNDNRVRARQSTAWESAIANLAISRVLRLQTDMMYFHAAAVSVGDSALLLMGPKGSAKTTLSLLLGSAGCGVYSDEIGVVHSSSRMVYPLGRAAGVREDALTILGESFADDTDRETYPDGSSRRNLRLSAVVADSTPASRTLESVFFLSSFAPAAKATPVPVTPALLRRVLLLPVTFWSAPAGRRLCQTATLLSRTRTFLLDVGPPDETVALVKQLAGGTD